MQRAHTKHLDAVPVDNIPVGEDRNGKCQARGRRNIIFVLLGRLDQHLVSPCLCLRVFACLLVHKMRECVVCMGGVSAYSLATPSCLHGRALLGKDPCL